MHAANHSWQRMVPTHQPGASVWCHFWLGPFQSHPVESFILGCSKPFLELGHPVGSFIHSWLHHIFGLFQAIFGVLRAASSASLTSFFASGQRPLGTAAAVATIGDLVWCMWPGSGGGSGLPVRCRGGGAFCHIAANVPNPH